MRPTLTRIASVASVAALALPLTACGSSSSSAANGSKVKCATPTSDLTVEAFDRLKFDADKFDASAGCIKVQYTNVGVIAHTLLVEGEKGFKLSVGKSDSGNIELSAGTYRIYCDLPGHEAAGMHAVLTVT